jgi:hypothetical protein
LDPRDVLAARRGAGARTFRHGAVVMRLTEPGQDPALRLELSAADAGCLAEALDVCQDSDAWVIADALSDAATPAWGTRGSSPWPASTA